MAILSKACKPDNFASHISPKFSFTNVWGLRSNFVDWKSFLESNSPDIFGTNLDDSVDSGNFSVRGYLPLIRKDSSTNMHSLPVYVKGLPFAWDLSLENSADSYLCFWLVLLHSVSCFFSSINHLACLCAPFFILFHLTWMRFPWSTHLLMCLSLESLTSIIRTGLPIHVELTNLVNSDVTWPYSDG